MMAWLTWFFIVVALTALMYLIALRIHNIEMEIRRLGRCHWLGCNNPADGGEWTAGEHYCIPHLEYLSYGLEEPL